MKEAATATAAPERTLRRVSNQRNVLVNWIAFVVTAVIGFVLSPFIVRSLGDDGYGVWALLGSITTYMFLLDLGIRSAVTRYTARFHAQARHSDAGRIASAALGAFGLLALLPLIAAAVLAPFLDNLFTIPPHLLGPARVVLVLSGITIGMSLLSGVFGGVITAMQRLDLLGGVTIVSELLRGAGIVLVLDRGGGLVGFALVHLAMAALRVAAQILLSRRLYPELRYRLRGWGRRELRDIFSFSVYSTLIYISGTIVIQADAIVIGAFLPVSMITYFAIGGALISYARNLNHPIVQTVPPRVSALEARGSLAGVTEVTLTTARLSTLVMLPILVTFLLRGGTFLGLWMGPQYAGPSGAVVAVLAAGYAFSASRSVVQGTFVGLNRHRYLVPWYIAEAVVNLAVSLLLIRPLGIVGVAWGTTGPSVLMSLVVVPLVARRRLGIPLRRLGTEAWGRPLAAVVPFAAVTWAMERWWPATSLLPFFGQVAAALPAAAAGAWLLALSADQRHAYVGRHVVRARDLLRSAPR